MPKRPEPQEEEVSPFDRSRTPDERLRAAGLVIRQRLRGREPLWKNRKGVVMGQAEALRKYCMEPYK